MGAAFNKRLGFSGPVLGFVPTPPPIGCFKAGLRFFRLVFIGSKSARFVPGKTTLNGNLLKRDLISGLSLDYTLIEFHFAGQDNYSCSRPDRYSIPGKNFKVDRYWMNSQLLLNWSDECPQLF